MIAAVTSRAFDLAVRLAPEWVVGALLGHAYGQLAAAHRRRWSDAVPFELQGAHVLIVGFGSIGEAVRHRLEPFGVTVTVHPEPLPDDHPLWDAALAITSHNAGDTSAATESPPRAGAGLRAAR